LRVSDGKWTTNKVLRTIQGVNLTGDTSLLIGRTITGQTSKATALVEAVSKFQIGANEVTEFTLNEKTIVGTFVTGEEIRGTESDTASSFIKVTSTGIPGTVTITNDGIYSNENDNVAIVGGGTGGLVTVGAVGNGGITDFVIDNAGTGYEIGDELVFNNANTSGGGATAAVSLVNGGLQVEGTTEDHIVLEDQTVIGDPYSGNKVVQESGTGNGEITDIRIINSGSNYVKVPTVTISSTSGENATVFAHGDEIGKVLGLKVVESGAEYNQSPSPPTLSIPGYMILKDISGSFVTDLTLTSVDSSSSAISATSGAFDSTRQLLKFSAASGTFQVDREITLSNGATATIAKVDQSTATVNVVALADTAGTFVNEDGHISDDAMRIQDSLYYQDFSYVIKVGRVINDWRDSFKKTMHTAGFYFTGQVNIESRISAQISQPVDGIISGIEESPIFGVITQLFSTIFGRRLGTTDDGTTQRANAELGVDPDFDDSTIEHFPQNTRDVTLRRHMTVKLSQTSTLYNISFGGNDFLRGYAWTGMSMGSTKMSSQPFSANNMFSGTHTKAQTTAIAGGIKGSNQYVSPMTFVNWADFRFNGLNSTSKDGEVVDFAGLGTDNLRTYIGYPTEINITVPSIGFDQTDITFDATDVTFDTV